METIKMNVQSIKLVAKKDECQYRIRFDNTGEYLINNNLTKINYGDTFTFQSLPTIKKLLKKIETIGYDTTDGFMTKEQHVEHFKPYMVNHNSDYEAWSNIDDKYKYEKEVERLNCIPKNKTIETQIDVELIVSNTFILETGSKYIVSDYFLGLDNPLCTFDVLKYVVEVFKDICIANGYVESKNDSEDKNCFYVPTHSGVRYAKINGTYVFDNEMEFKGNFRGTYEKCIEFQQKQKQIVEDKVNKFFNMLNGKRKIDDVELLTKLNLLLNSLDKIDVKIAGVPQLNSSKHLLKDLIKSL